MKTTRHDVVVELLSADRTDLACVVAQGDLSWVPVAITGLNTLLGLADQWVKKGQSAAQNLKHDPDQLQRLIEIFKQFQHIGKQGLGTATTLKRRIR